VANSVNDCDLVFFCPDVTDASVIKRVRQFQDYGRSVTVFGFRRERYNRQYVPSWPFVPLGFTRDGRYGQRLRALLGALPAVFAHRRMVKAASDIYARNIDQLVLALLTRWLAGSRAPVTYEVLDIPPILTGRGLASRLLRALERYCIKRSQLLVLSSPGFHQHYYQAFQRYRGEWFLLENKLHPLIARTAAAPEIPPSPAIVVDAPKRWVVGYVGLIRGEETVGLIRRLAERLRERVLFRFHGVTTTVDEETFLATVNQHENMVYDGPYLPYQDLSRIYADIDLAWALDLEHINHNSRWLLPCRFYEAGYFGVPCMAVRGFEVGALIERFGIGWMFDDPLEESLIEFFNRLEPASYAATRQRLRSVPTSMFVDSDDAGALCARLDARSRPSCGF
jgi:succinoglycan biosynthesis protein ExoL